ncbi:MAG: sel1 repeat family protein, partial [Burkholderiaceae bacterium]|nr:sel1 repeat family protein [Burkholderiaceae bacterium]
MPSLRRRPPPTVSALALALSLALGLTAPSASADMFCGEPSTKNTDPSDLSNGISDQSLEYMAQQPASMLVCSKGYLFEKCGDHDTSNKIFDKCIAAGYAGAMIWKARMLEEGNGGGPPDLAKSAELLHRAAVSGDPAYGPIAKMHYATALQLGRGVDKDEAEARRWFEQAAAEGSAEARDFLQTGYHTGSRDYSTLE